MKKRYLTPTIDFEVLEEDEILAASGKAEYILLGEDENGNDANQESGDIGIGDDDFWME